MFRALMLLQRSEHFSLKLLWWGNAFISRVLLCSERTQNLTVWLVIFLGKCFKLALMCDLIGHFKVLFIVKEILSQWRCTKDIRF